MKKILLSSVALFGLTAGALAADLPARRMAPVAPFTAVPVFTWTGFYVGVNAGYGFVDRNSRDVLIPAGSVTNSAATAGTLTFLNDRKEDGFVGGGQIGYNYQIGSIVVGVEADIQYADLGSRNNRDSITTGYVFTGAPGVAFAPPAATVVRNGVGIDWFGTVRARAGFAMDRALIYATGGFAYGGGGNNNCFGTFCGDDVNGGYVVGGGLEYAFTNNITAKIEGLYVNLDRGNRNRGAFYDTATNTVFVNDRKDNDFAVVRAGLNFKFNTF